MGYLPVLNETPTMRDMVSQFGGYNHNPRIPENEFDDMGNMSSIYYPVLSPRPKRGTLTLLTKPNGITAKSNLFWVEGTSLYHNGALVTGLTLTDNAKQFVSMGAFLLIWPDKVYYNTVDFTHGPLEASITIESTVTCTLTTITGDAYATPTVSVTEPAAPNDGDLWLDTSQTPKLLKRFAEATGAWVPIATTYIKITATNIGAQFAEYDGVTISGFTEESLNKEFLLYGAGDDYIVIAALLDENILQEGGVTVKRSVPDMDFLTECENRVWGCSKTKNEVYACKLGDPKNWSVFMGIATDSYAANVGSDGAFTACCTYFGQVLFWKEDILHKLTGNKPANYQIVAIPCRGVEKGSEKSLQVVNERLYYKARTAICAYDGSIPITISDRLGEMRYRNGVAGSLGNRYYISMKDEAGAWHMFVFDASLGLWHREDATQAAQFAAHEGELFYIDAATKKIMSVNGRLSVSEGGTKYSEDHGAAEADVAWYVETGEIGLDLPDNKHIGRLMFRLEVPAPKNIVVSLKYDGSSTWIDHTISIKTPLRTVALPIHTRRCDYLKMKIAGVGDCKIFSITKTVEGGNYG